MVVLSTTKLLKAGEGPSLENRVRRLENGFSRMMSNYNNSSSPKETLNNFEMSNRNSRDMDKEHLDLKQKAKLKSSRDVDLRKDRTQSWVIEFECPSCNTLNTRGIDHDRLHKYEDEFNHRVYLNCLNCDWKSDPVNIRGFN